MGIHERGQRRTERKRRVGQHLRRLQDQAGVAAFCPERLVGGGEYRAISAQLRRYHNHRDQYHDVDHDVLDESDRAGFPLLERSTDRIVACHDEFAVVALR
jgi:hypothetical protein